MHLDFQLMYVLWYNVNPFFLGVGKGNGTDMKVQIIVRKQVVLECVCASQRNCKVRVL